MSKKLIDAKKFTLDIDKIYKNDFNNYYKKNIFYYIQKRKIFYLMFNLLLLN